MRCSQSGACQAVMFWIATPGRMGLYPYMLIARADHTDCTLRGGTTNENHEHVWGMKTHEIFQVFGIVTMRLPLGLQKIYGIARSEPDTPSN